MAGVVGLAQTVVRGQDKPLPSGPDVKVEAERSKEAQYCRHGQNHYHNSYSDANHPFYLHLPLAVRRDKPTGIGYCTATTTAPPHPTLSRSAGPALPERLKLRPLGRKTIERGKHWDVW